MTDQHTITLTKNQAQALMLHASKDTARTHLSAVAISSDGIAMTTQGHTMFTIRPEDSDADPRKYGPDRKWIVLTRSAVDQAIKLASTKQSIRIDGTISSSKGTAQFAGVDPHTVPVDKRGMPVAQDGQAGGHFSLIFILPSELFP